ncbi:unnamed protein product [Sphagnum jensenii]|uniref:Pentatricopeptide repeat-containing protein n=1 Tax=Sphagnum jensenii TaxID=128206 RepID=A0ABP1A806_9BRYO
MAAMAAGTVQLSMTKGTGTISTNATRSVVAVEEGRRVHDQIIQSALESVVFLGNSLHDMYAKCGSIEDARKVFHKMQSQDVVTWTAILGGFAIHGHGYVLLSSIYSAADSRNLCENVEQQRKQRGVKKLLGHSQIEVSHEVRTMNAVDNEYHPCRTAEIVRALA